MGYPAIVETGEQPACTDNFQISPFELDGKRWQSVEQCFQALKFRNDELVERIRALQPSYDDDAASFGMKVIQAGRARDPSFRADWEQVKQEIMYRAVRAKFAYSSENRAELLATGTKRIQHPEQGFWGEWNTNIILRVREELRAPGERNQGLLSELIHRFEQQASTSLDSILPSLVDLPLSASSAVRVALVGDSTLDNIVWVDSPDQAVTPMLQRRLEPQSPGATVYNLAADGFTSTDTLYGGEAFISFAERRDAGDPFPGYEGTLNAPFTPLTHLEALSPPPTHVVLSIGGNDVREILGAMHQLPQRIAAFHDNYPQIAARCAASGARMILMLQYRPDEATDEEHYGVYRAIEAATPGPGTRVQKLNALMEAIYPPVLALAAENGWDVLDLPNTFDIRDTELYRHQIEPSAKGSQLIAELIEHAVLHRHEEMPGSVLISKPVGSGAIVEKPNDPAVPWRIAEPE